MRKISVSRSLVLSLQFLSLSNTYHLALRSWVAPNVLTVPYYILVTAMGLVVKIICRVEDFHPLDHVLGSKASRQEKKASLVGRVDSQLLRSCYGSMFLDKLSSFPLSHLDNHIRPVVTTRVQRDNLSTYLALAGP